jgi:UDP-N-acetylglucosamine:LPS N-acetylglucosamine transferase
MAEAPNGSTPGTILLVASSGGHLAQLIALQPWYESRERRWVTFQTADASSLLRDEEVVWAHHPTTRNVKNLVRNALLAVKVLRDRDIAAVVTTGAGVALPFVALARLRGIPSVYIEVFDRIDTRTLTARLCRPFLSAFLVQWEEQRRLYPDATVVGQLL